MNSEQLDNILVEKLTNSELFLTALQRIYTEPDRTRYKMEITKSMITKLVDHPDFVKDPDTKPFIEHLWGILNIYNQLL